MEEEQDLTYEEIMEILQEELSIMNAEEEYQDLDFNK